MGAVVDLIDKIKRYYKFTAHELRGLAISILVIAFVISFDKWGAKSFDFGAGFYNFLNSILIAALSILVHDAGQRIWGLAIGYRIEFRMWIFGLIASLVIAFLNNGRIPYLWLIVPGGFMLHHLAGHRLGFFRYGINYFGQAMVAFAGTLFTLTLIILLQVIRSFFPSTLIIEAIRFNVIYLIISLLPIPPMDGSKIFFGSRMAYAFIMPAMMFATIMIVVNIPIFLSIVLSLLVGVILWIAYYISFERKVWRGS